MEITEPDNGAAADGSDAADAGSADVPEVAPDEGEDVAGRDPDEIAREIDQTRAELADTIDAIADRVSPKRAATRGVQAVKAQVSGARGDGEADDGSPMSAEDAERTLAAIAPKIAAAGVLLLILVFLLRRRSR